MMKAIQVSIAFMALATLAASAQQRGEVAVPPSGAPTSFGEAEEEAHRHRTCELPPMPEGPPTAWPGGVVYYEFDSNVGLSDQYRMYAAMDELMFLGGALFVDLTFLPREPGDNDYLHIEDGFSGPSWTTSIGYQSGRTTISIGDWHVHGELVHELLHALGFWHEQLRPDRDSYVTINWGNIPPGAEMFFDIQPAFPSWGLTAYDYGSVMHDSECARSICSSCSAFSPNCWTILAGAPIGQRTGTSSTDRADLQNAYGTRPSGTTPFYCSNRGSVLPPYGGLETPLPYLNLLNTYATGRTAYVEAGTYLNVGTLSASPKAIRAIGGSVRLVGGIE